MKKRILVLVLFVFIAVIIVACGSNGSQTAELNDLENKIVELEKENSELKVKNEKLQKENEQLNAQIEKENQEKLVQESDVTVLLTGKSTSSDRFNRMFVDFVFSVENNTDKAIKGVQGIATFKDIFDVEIIPIQCDFTGQTIEPGATITVKDLQLDCNQFMDDHMKLYNTDFSDLHFEYKVTTIVFADGTSKSGT